ncbi:ABC transporter ATP-binding protein [Halodesulfovibrio sp.]|uniref:ABC transporter ATP-binding protein n=1 Tax=Halodesulfovibrio sp. TaxID=1912772 RepID=UPI0025D6C28F|nr:ABC transporter ATP-binding protein [Halodesulfovibrio sp.]MCT4625458.1 ABC transporter ATP-binding protein/permease [Halodesulfovibrio sp.]
MGAVILKKDTSLLVKRLLKLFRPHRKKLAFILCCLAFQAFFAFMRPFLTKYLIDDGVVKQELAFVTKMIIVMLSLALLSSAIDVFKELLRATIASEIYQKLIADSFRALSKISISFFHHNDAAETLNNLDVDITNIKKICDDEIFLAISELLTFIGSVVGLFFLEKRLSLLVFLFVPVKFIIVKHFSRHCHGCAEQLINSSYAFAQCFGEHVNAMQDIRRFGIINERKQVINAQAKQVAGHARDMSVVARYNMSSEFFVVRLIEALILLIGAHFVVGNTMTIGCLFAFIACSMQVIGPVGSILNIMYLLSGVLPSAQRHFMFLDSSQAQQELDGHEPLSLINEIEFKNVSFGYHTQKTLQNINFTLKGTETLAIVGPNGSGKSTILQLLERFYTPDSGCVLVNGRNVDEYDLEAYRKSYLSINPHSYLFNASIYDNITLGEPFSELSVLAAIKKSGLTELVERKKYTPVGVNGRTLSSGQRQKVFLARILLRKKNCYIFDEASSNMDSASEASLFALFEGPLKEAMSIVVTHNHNNLNKLDKVLMLEDDGSATFYNSYAELISKQASG